MTLELSRGAAAVLAVCMLVVAIACGSGAGRPASQQAAPEPAAAANSAGPAAAPSLAAPSAPAAPASGSAAASLQPLSPPVSVKVGEHGVVSNAPLYIALDRGYFQEQGLDLELVRFQTGPAMMAPLAAGQIDVAVGAPGASLFNAIARDIPLRIVADKGSGEFQGKSYTALLARRDLVESGDLREYADLKGKRVALPSTGSTNEVQVAMALQKGGLSNDDVEWQTMSQPDTMVALANKSSDVAVAIEPFVARAVQEGIAVRWHGTEEHYPGAVQGLLFYGPGFVTDKQEAARRFMVAWIKGVRDYNDAFEKGTRRAETIAILQKYTDVKDAATYDLMVPAAIDRNGTVNVKDLEFQQDYYLKTGTQQTAINMRDVVDPEFAEYAVSVLGRQ